MDEQFDVTARKFHQWSVIALSAVAFILDGVAGGALMVAVALVMIVGRFRDEADLLRGFYYAVLKPAGILKPRMVVEDRATRRIARVLGGSIQLLAGLAIIAGASAAGSTSYAEVAAVAWGAVGLIALMIALDAAFDFCVLCFVVHQVRRATV